eukprot:gb/GECH01002655.1/.p1 GENE.gb/GECH01002655.1/~~gb/GECH01002655.1/.p1  ORF type:complete len:618 (+),score=146.99 gb/GECH01002655.1/:1-1854(+)
MNDEESIPQPAFTNSPPGSPKNNNTRESSITTTQEHLDQHKEQVPELKLSTPSHSSSKHTHYYNDNQENNNDDDDRIDLFSPRSNAPVFTKVSPSQNMSADNPFSQKEQNQNNDHLHSKFYDPEYEGAYFLDRDPPKEKNDTREEFFQQGISPESIDRIEAWIRGYRVRRKLMLSDSARYKLMQIKDLTSSVDNEQGSADPRMAWFSAIKRSLSKTKTDLMEFLENGEPIAEQDKMNDMDQVIFSSKNTEIGKLLKNASWVANLKHSVSSSVNPQAQLGNIRAKTGHLRTSTKQSKPKRPSVSKSNNLNGKNTKKRALSKLEALNAKRESSDSFLSTKTQENENKTSFVQQNTPKEVEEHSNVATRSSKIFEPVNDESTPTPIDTDKEPSYSQEQKFSTQKEIDSSDKDSKTDSESSESSRKFSFLRRKSRSMRPQKLTWKNVKSRVDCRNESPRPNKNQRSKSVVHKKTDFSKVKSRVNTGRTKNHSSDNSDMSSTNSESSGNEFNYVRPHSAASMGYQRKSQFGFENQSKRKIPQNINQTDPLPKFEVLIEEDTSQTQQFLQSIFHKRNGSAVVPQIKFDEPLFSGLTFEQYSGIKKKLLKSSKHGNCISFNRVN